MFTIDDYYFETLFVKQASRKSVLFNYAFKDAKISRFYPYRKDENTLGKIMNGLTIKSKASNTSITYGNFRLKNRSRKKR